MKTRPVPKDPRPPIPVKRVGTAVSVDHVPKGKGERESRGKSHRVPFIPVLSGWDNNGHVFEKNLICKCRKTLAQHNQDPWACPLAIGQLTKEVEELRKSVSNKTTRLQRDLRILLNRVKGKSDPKTSPEPSPVDKFPGVLPDDTRAEDDSSDMLDDDGG